MRLFTLSDGQHQWKSDIAIAIAQCVDPQFIGVDRTRVLSIRPFYANPKFGNNFREFVHHRKDVIYMETGV